MAQSRKAELLTVGEVWKAIDNLLYFQYSWGEVTKVTDIESEA